MSAKLGFVSLKVDFGIEILRFRIGLKSRGGDMLSILLGRPSGFDAGPYFRRERRGLRKRTPSPVPSSSMNSIPLVFSPLPPSQSDTRTTAIFGKEFDTRGL